MHAILIAFSVYVTEKGSRAPHYVKNRYVKWDVWENWRISSNWSCAPTWHQVPTPWGKLCGCTQDASTQQLKQVHLHHFKRLQKHPKTEYSTRKEIKYLHKFKALTTHVWLFVREGDGKGSLPVWLVLPLPYNNGSGLLLTVSTCPRHCHLWHKDRENYGSRFHSHSIMYVLFALCTSQFWTVSDPLC